MNKKSCFRESALKLYGSSRIGKHGRRVIPGELPGIEHIAASLIAPKARSVAISYVDYSATQIETGDIINLDDFLDKPLPSWLCGEVDQCQ